MINIDELAARAKENIPEEPGDYVVEDGFLHCGRCGGAKECVSIIMGRTFRHRKLCPCLVKKRDEELEARRKQEEYDRLMSMKSVAMADRSQRESTFESADGRNQNKMESIQRYANAWPQMLAENIGLMLYGGVGSGKSYAAACIANRIVEQHKQPVMMTSFGRIFNALSIGMAEDKNAYIKNLVSYPLLIIDDFGAERDTAYALEQVFDVIDARYRVKKPLIITTNLSPADMVAKDMEHARIYDRITEMCVPFNFGDNGERKQAGIQKRHLAASILKP